MIWKTYKYLYYRLYIWYRKKFGDNDAPEYSAAIVMTMNVGLNFGSLIIIVNLVTGVMIIPLDIPKISVLILYLMLLIIHYFAFIHRGKYRKIEKEFKKERKKGYGKVGWYYYIQ